MNLKFLKTEQKLDTILNHTFKYAKKLAKDFYFNVWAKNSPKCPALGGEIINITREGWEHIIDETSRTKADVLGRLFVLERAKVLLETANIFTTKEKRQKGEYWIFDGVIKQVRIKVVVRSIEGTPKHFLTVIKKGTIENEIK